MSRSAYVELCVGAAIVRTGRILLLRRSMRSTFLPGRWDIPGGHVGAVETLTQALRREVREETALTIEVGAPIGASEFQVPTPAGRGARTVEIDFSCTCSGSRGPTLDGKEHSEYAWVGPLDLARYRVPRPLLPTVRTALQVRG